MLIYLLSLVSNSVVKGLKAHPSNRDAIRKITHGRLIHSIICCFYVFVFVWWGDNLLFFLVVAQTYPKSPLVTTFPEYVSFDWPYLVMLAAWRDRGGDQRRDSPQTHLHHHHGNTWAPSCSLRPLQGANLHPPEQPKHLHVPHWS